MKKILLILFLAFAAMMAQAQKPGQIPANLPPGYLEMLKKNMPPGVQLPPEMMKMLQQAESQQNGSGSSQPMPEPLVPMQPVQQMSYQSGQGSQYDYSPFGSGRNETQRKMAVIAIENELEAKSLLLPLPESTPTKAYMLNMAAEQYKLAKQKFKPNDLTEYSRLVTWVPRFDGSLVNKDLAAKYSMAVALSTNNNPYPYFNIALACATFSFDPENPVQANNLASAIISGGELVTEKNPTTESLAPYRRDAESGFLYAIAHSMKNDEWSETTLTPAINLGNLCIDLERLEEARSLFMVARKIKPESWDAALGLAAYFMALNQKDKALAILEDDRLDKPQKEGIPIKKNKALEKSEPFSDLPPESPEEKYEEGINIMAQEPVMTSADFIAQLDQSERNKMRYFIENLPVKGSFKAPPIKKLTQYASLKAISSPQGISALLEFSQMMGIYSLGSFASTSNQQLDWLSKFGMKIDPGVDMNDVARHPEKYAGKDMKVKPKISGKEEFLANMQEMKKEAQKARLDLATGKTESLTKLATKIDNVHGILLINPEDYADPMNIVMQKMNYTVYQRKNHLYQGYLYALTKKTYRQVSEIIEQCNRKIAELSKLREAEMEQYEKARAAAEKQARDSGSEFPSAEWDMRRHNIHVKFFNAFNGIEEPGFGSATNVVSVAYIQKIKPAAENYYYDVFRHVALISDPEVRDQKNADLKNSIYSALTMALQTVQMAHGSFAYSDHWDCSCNLEELLAAREAEQKAMHEEENARIERNKAAKAVFDSGEIPESSPLFKKLDAYVDVYNFGLVKVRASCARTTLEANTDFLPNNLPFKFKYSSSESEFTGAITRNAGIKVGVEKELSKTSSVNANLNLDISVSSDGNGNVKNYSVTGGADAGVKVGNFSAGVGVQASNNNGVTDYSVSGNAKVGVKYGDTKVSGGASASYSMSKGLDSDFSAGVSRDWKNEIGTSANVKAEVSTKRGCSFSHKVEQTLTPVKKAVDSANKAIEDSGLEIPSDFLTKELWSGKYESKK